MRARTDTDSGNRYSRRNLPRGVDGNAFQHYAEASGIGDSLSLIGELSRRLLATTLHLEPTETVHGLLG